jgi:hypothetical protein
VHEDDRHLARLAGLHQRERLEELVQGAEAARQHDVGGGELREHHLAREEVLEAQADVLVAARGLLARQVDVQAHRHAAPGEGALVRRFHEARAAAGEHGEARVGEQAGGLLGELVVARAGLDARAAEHRYRGLHAGEPLRRLEELCHNAEQLPRLARGYLVAETGRLQ